MVRLQSAKLSYVGSSPIRHSKYAPFVYRLGHRVFIPVRGVRPSYGVPMYQEVLVKKTVVRKVVIREGRDFAGLRRRTLIKSDYGHKALYDTCEWRTITEQDLLLETIKQGKKIEAKDLYRNILYNPQYHRWHWFVSHDGSVMIDSGKTNIKKLGIVTLTKFKG